MSLQTINSTNNTITNGLGEKAGLSNAIQIMSPTVDNPLLNYVITDNKLTGHIKGVANWASSGIIIAQGYSPGSAGTYIEAITATDKDYANLLANNTFENNKIDLTHQDWSKPSDEVVLYPCPVDETKAVVTNKTELEAALTNDKVTEITVSGEIGNESSYTRYEVDRTVTIQGEDANAKVYGTFRVNVNGITIQNLAIQNQGNPTGNDWNRVAVYIIAQDVTLKNNIITNGLVTGDGLSNAITIRSALGETSLSSYDITDNTITGHEQGVDKWASTGLEIIQNWSIATSEKVTATLVEYVAILEGNTFTNNAIDLDHTDYGSATVTEKTVLFRSPLNYVEILKSKITKAEAKVEANYTTVTWSTLQTELTEAKEVESKIGTADGTYQATIINAHNKLKSALDGLVEVAGD